MRGKERRDGEHQTSKSWGRGEVVERDSGRGDGRKEAAWERDRMSEEQQAAVTRRVVSLEE